LLDADQAEDARRLDVRREDPFESVDAVVILVNHDAFGDPTRADLTAGNDPAPAVVDVPNCLDDETAADLISPQPLMYRNHAVAAVVAARNEAPFIDDVVDAMPAFVDRIYVVDDASEDDTRAVALGAAVGHPRTSPRWCPERRRLDSRAAETDQAGRVAVLDESTPLAAPSKHWATSPRSTRRCGSSPRPSTATDRWTRAASNGSVPLVDGDADYAKGTRRRYVPPLWKSAIDAAVLTLSGYWSLTDPVNGYTAIRREALKSYRSRVRLRGYGYGTEVLARLTPPAAESLMCRIRAATATKTAGSTTGSTPPE